MRYILVGLTFGVAWAAIQYARGTQPPEVAVLVILCGVFGALLWGARALLLRYRGRK